MTDREYLSCSDTAKLVRKAVKAAFPGIKFSVRSSTYSGGASIDVRWTDGPTAKQVDPIAKQFAGATFDGMIDMKSYHDSYINALGVEVDPDSPDARRVHFGSDYVFCHREISDGMKASTQAAWDALNDLEKDQLVHSVRDLWLSKQRFGDDEVMTSLPHCIAVDAAGHTEIITDRC